MEPCCETAPDAGRRCPACGGTGRSVDRITVKAMLRPAALARLSAAEYRFCFTPGCPLVYFAPSEQFGIEEVAVPVFQKEPPGARTVCYCLAISEADIRDELATTGLSTAIERISTLVKTDRCACEIKNPQGSCCLGNVAAVIKPAEIGTVRAARPEPAKGRPRLEQNA